MIPKSIKHIAYFMNYSSQKMFDDVRNNVLTISTKIPTESSLFQGISTLIFILVVEINSN